MLVAVAQIEPKLGERERNLEACLARLEEAAAAGAELLVLPGNSYHVAASDADACAQAALAFIKRN